MIRACILVILLLVCWRAAAQKMKSYNFRDTLDNKLDFSSFLLDPNGFIPFVTPVTEPALGHIGVLGGPVIIKPNKHSKKGEYIRPTITAVIAGYTANKSWFTGGMHKGMIAGPRLKYSILAGYGNINLDFYHDFPQLGRRGFEFNFKSITVIGSMMKRIMKTDLYAGLEYVFLSNDITPIAQNSRIEDFVDDRDFESKISMPAVVLEFDDRDSEFTPDRGTFINVAYHFNANWTGSDYTYHNFTFTALEYLQFTDSWISGFRFDGIWQGGDAPFYMEPSIQLRGVPQSKYQGTSTYVLETEQRYDVTLRWSGVAFGGVAKALPQGTTFSDATLVYNYGVGFRYLLARLFKVRVGVDFAWSNDDFGYYITFGSAWNQLN